MSADVVIRVEKVSKRYMIRHGDGKASGDGLRHMLHDAVTNSIRMLKARMGRRSEKSTAARCSTATRDDGGSDASYSSTEEFYALRDVSLDVHRGEVVGIIGRNGAGKSTLLKILSRITEPTSGRIGIKGRVASLLEVGTGFHQELTGRENIFLNGAILGMSRSEIKSKFDEIVAFSEVEKFLDTPVKRYSSGMYVRLAFAVAAHLEPDILIVDEVLAVGDLEFQKKCAGKLKDVAEGGRTVLFVSHNLTALRQLCSRGVLLAKGSVSYAGSLDETVTRYLANAESGLHAYKRERLPDQHERAVITSVAVTDQQGKESGSYIATDEVRVEIMVDCLDILPPCQLAVRVNNQDGVPVFTTSNIDAEETLRPLTKGTHTFQFCIPPSLLSDGRYSLTLCLCIPGVEAFETLNDIVCFEVFPGVNHATKFHDFRRGVVTPLLGWKHYV